MVTNPEEKSTRPCLHAVGYRVQVKRLLALWMWCARQRAFVRQESTQAQNREVGMLTRLVSTGHTRVWLCRYVRSTQRVCAWALGWEFYLARESALSVKLPYSGKLSREKTFANFADSCSATKVFPVNIWGRGTQHTAGIFGTCVLKVLSIDRHVLAQILSDKLITTKVWWSQLFPLWVLSVRGIHPDTDIQARKLHPRREGTGQKTGHGVWCDSVSSPFLLPIDRWLKVPRVRLHHVARCSEYNYRLIVRGGCDYLCKCARMHTMWMATPMQIG